MELARPARYFPIQNGLYEVGPGLRPFGTDFGNGPLDKVVFQFDSDFPRYRDNRMHCRAERLGKYHATHDFQPNIETGVARFLIAKLSEEHPSLFRFLPKGDKGAGRLECRLTSETLEFDDEMSLVSAESRDYFLVKAPYVSAFDALCSQVQEDVAVMSVGLDENGAKKNWLSALHLCSPSHWAAEDKIGKDFFAIHAPVAEIEKMNRAHAAIVEGMIHKGPYVRFVWGFGSDNRLNHHPVPPPETDAIQWKGRSFDASAASPFILRVERQVTYGLPALNASMFTIRTSFIDGNAIKKDPTERALLRSALLSMTPASRVYKGLDRCMDQVIAWLDAK